MVEDVVTTAGSTRETMAVAEQHGAQVVGRVLDRRPKRRHARSRAALRRPPPDAPADLRRSRVPAVSAGIAVTKPGSRPAPSARRTDELSRAIANRLRNSQLLIRFALEVLFHVSDLQAHHRLRRHRLRRVAVAGQPADRAGRSRRGAAADRRRARRGACGRPHRFRCARGGQVVSFSLVVDLAATRCVRALNVGCPDATSA